MSTAGLSRPDLDRLHRVLAAQVERRDLPGLVAVVSRSGDAQVETIGTLAFDDATPMALDTIFRIASLTKLATAVAALILVEGCRIRLDSSIDRWLPELADRRVLRSLASEPDDTVPAHRPITLRDLLTYRMGFGGIMAMPGTYPIQKLIRDLRIGGDGPMLATDYPPTDEWLRRLGSLPLLTQPGEAWHYQVSGDVLGALIARVAGRSLGAFMRERIFEPLGMKDTGFRVPAEKLRRMPAFYRFDREANALTHFEDPAHNAYAAEPPFESGGGGLAASLDDWFAFHRMLLGRGRLGRERILSPATVALMTSDQLPPEQRTANPIFFGRHSSWGLGFAVDIARTEIFHSPGRYGWTGGFGTTTYNDPANDLIGILFTQRMMDSPEPPAVFVDFWTAAYGAMG